MSNDGMGVPGMGVPGMGVPNGHYECGEVRAGCKRVDVEGFWVAPDQSVTELRDWLEGAPMNTVIEVDSEDERLVLYRWVRLTDDEMDACRQEINEREVARREQLDRWREKFGYVPEPVATVAEYLRQQSREFSFKMHEMAERELGELPED